MSKVIAVCCSDIHLSENPPIARSDEPDWFEAQDRMLCQVQELMDKHKAICLCGGDVFHRYNPSPTMINWALDHLPKMFSVPGQHDLPMHCYEDVKRSAYWTLVLGDVIVDMAECSHDGWVVPDKLHVLGYPWGKDIHELEGREDYPDSNELQLCLTHRYVWILGKGYSGAPGENHLNLLGNSLKGYDLALFGDNHQSFSSVCGDCRVMNPGCLIPRKSDERGYKPTVFLLKDNGRFSEYHLDTSADKWTDTDEDDGSGSTRLEMGEFLSEMSSSTDDFPNFRESVLRYVENADNNVDEETKRVILEVLGE